MTLTTFKDSLTGNLPPEELSVYLRALWYDAKGNWQRAHDLIDHLEGETAAHVHAYLHRKEGDIWNAQYWYNRAKQAMPEKPLDEEWGDLFRLLSTKS